VRNVPLKDIHVEFFDNGLKVNVHSIKYFTAIDFPFEIQFDDARNRVQLLDDSLEIFINKKERRLWDQVQVEGLSKEELFERRRAA